MRPIEGKNLGRMMEVLADRHRRPGVGAVAHAAGGNGRPVRVVRLLRRGGGRAEDERGERGQPAVRAWGGHGILLGVFPPWQLAQAVDRGR